MIHWSWLLCLINIVFPLPCSLNLQENTELKIAGVLTCDGEDACSIGICHTQLSFVMSQSNNNAFLSLTNKYGKTLMRFEVVDGVIRSTRVFGNSVPSKEILLKLESSDEYRLLPALSSLLGHEYNVTARRWPVAMLLYRLAMASELHHRIEERAELHINKKYAMKRSLSEKLNTFQMLAGKLVRQFNPWTYDPDEEVLCASPDGLCDERIETDKGSICQAHGQPLRTKDVKAGCMGLCGPSCFRCWSYICGDCCRHPGCYSHDTKCAEGYLSLECITGKGLVWGDNTEIC